jgi:LacI family transcriptional regulator
MMHRTVCGLAADAVVVDNADGTRRAIAHLAERGHRRIAMITGPLTVSTVSERHAAFLRTVRELGIRSEDAPVEFATYDEESGYNAALRLLDRQQRPDAIFVALNVLMLGVLKAVQARGLRVPHDVALIGFDDLRWAAAVSPPLTMVAEPTFEVGARAAQILIDRIKSKLRKAPRVEVLKTVLVERSSC